MQVAYRVSQSPGKGQGIFLLEPVPQYALVWEFSAANLRVYNERGARELVAQTQPAGLTNLLSYAYFSADGLLVDLREDDGRFFNHSGTPNVALGSVLLAQGIPGDFHPMSTYALRDLQSGEELLDDYNTYGTPFCGPTKRNKRRKGIYYYAWEKKNKKESNVPQ